MIKHILVTIVGMASLCGALVAETPSPVTITDPATGESLTVTTVENADGSKVVTYRFAKEGVLQGKEKKSERIRPDGQLAIATETTYSAQGVAIQSVQHVSTFDADKLRETRKNVSALHTEEGRIRGKAKTLEIFDDTGKLIETRKYTYDADARDIKTETLAEGKPARTALREFNAEGRLAKEQSFADGNLVGIILREFNADGRTAKEQFFATAKKTTNPADLTPTGEKHYTYLADGRPDKTENFRNGALVSTDQNNYDADGKRTVENILAPALADPVLHSVALDELGATGKILNTGFHRDWPIANCLRRADGGSGILLYQMKQALVEVTLLKPMPIAAIELTSLDYHGTQFIKTVDLYVDGKLVKKGVEFPGEMEPVFDLTGNHRGFRQPNVRVDLHGGVNGRVVGIQVTDVHPPRSTEGPENRPKTVGGFNRIRVYSTEDLTPFIAIPADYKVAKTADADGNPIDQKAIAFSAALAAVPKVHAEVRTTPKGVNPNTIWDAKDIARMKELLKKSPIMQQQLAEMIKKLDARIAQPFNIPPAVKDEKGEWRHASDQEEGRGGKHNQLANDICDMGIVYALTGEAKYAEYCRKLLIEYAKIYQNYRPGNRPGFTHDVGMLYDQRLGDGTWLLRAVRGYDLIANLPSWTEADRKLVTDDFLKHLAYFISANRGNHFAPTNWSAINNASILLTGYATHDEELIDRGKFGWTDAKGDRHGGVFFHFGPDCIDIDGMWSEGAMGYQFMAMQALIAYAETMLHHGENLYAYRDGAFKHLFDSPMWFSYPNLHAPAIHDSGSGSIFGTDSGVWEYGYLRYRDPNYLTLLKNIPLALHSRFQIYADSVLYDVDKDQPTPPISVGSMNLDGVGYGITRVNAGDKGQRYILFDYGPNRSHGHPDKMQIDVWANGEQLAPDPGCVWYEVPMYAKWYNKTIAHNTVTVDEMCQRPSDGVQTVFAPGETVAMQRGYANEAVPGVTKDRAFFMFDDYVLDIFGAFAKMPRLYDMAWHIRGDFELPEGMKDREKFEAAGYMELDDVKELTTKDAFSVGFTSPLKGAKSRFHAAPAPDTTYYTGLGVYQRERPLTIIARRKAADTIFCGALDYSGTGDYVKSVTGSGDMKKGYYLAKAVTADGTDLGYASFNGGTNTAETMTTDALQALIRLDDKGAVYTAALAGGKTLKNGPFALELSDKGSVIVEKTLAGTWLITNLLNEPTTLKLAADFARGLKIVALRADGSLAEAPTKDFAGAVALPPLGKYELLPSGNEGYHKISMNIRAALQAAEQAAVTEQRTAARARNKARHAYAAEAPIKDFSIEIPAITFTAETGGEAVRAVDKFAAKTKEGTVLRWQGDEHALTWEVEVPAEGYYVLSARYCTEMNNPTRTLAVNGEVQEPLSPFTFPTTGGWARANDDWKTAYARDAIDGQPLLIKLNKGQNTITMISHDNFGVNVDYLVVASPDKVEKE